MGFAPRGGEVRDVMLDGVVVSAIEINTCFQEYLILRMERYVP
jgi:hypothetical protein